MKKPLRHLASFRLRFLFRTSFLLLTLAVLAMAIVVLQGEKQRSYDNYKDGFLKTKAQIMSRLYHPSGLLALLNPRRGENGVMPERPVVLPFSAIDFDDQNKVRHAIEMAECLVPYKNGGSLCVAIGNNPRMGGFIYVAGTFVSGPLEAHRIGDKFFDEAHRLRVKVSHNAQKWQYLAPFELPPDDTTVTEGTRGRFTGYMERSEPDYTGAKPLREFRGWVWQSGRCQDGTLAEMPYEFSSLDESADAEAEETRCMRSSFFSLRLPVETLRQLLFRKKPVQWPPKDLDQYRVSVEVLPPGEGKALFDSSGEITAPPFLLSDLATLLLPGETLTLNRQGDDNDISLRFSSKEDSKDQPAPWLTRLIRRLPVERQETTEIAMNDEIMTPLGSYQLAFQGDARSVDQALAITATRLSWFAAAMLGAIALAWLIIEIGLIRRIARLTARTRGFSSSARPENDLDQHDWSDLRSNDELGILAGALNDLFLRVKEDAQRERIRAEQEKDQWHAVGHEIVSPLQSLLALHNSPDDPSHRYINRMQQAVRILYGSASPSEAFLSSNLAVQSVDIAEFLRHVVESSGVSDVFCSGADEAVLVRADEYSLEDVFSHILKNADRYRQSETPIALRLETSERTATVHISNTGPVIPDDLIGTIFEYGVSDQPEAAGSGNRGQGLFVAKTYMAKMGGTITVSNESDGVCFRLVLQRIDVPR